MPELTIDLADGRTLDFDRGDRPLEKEPPKGLIPEEILSASVRNTRSNLVQISDRSVDLIGFNPAEPDNVIVIEIKADVRKSRPAQLSDATLRRQLGTYFEAQNLNPNRVRLMKQLWRPDIRGGALWAYDIDAAGNRIEPPTYYRLSSIRHQARGDTEESGRINPELEGPVTKEHLRQRLQDWENRIQGLFQQINTWLAEERGYRVDQNQRVVIQEELMENFGIPPIALPVLNITKDTRHLLTVKPYALWIIGANGRLDLIARHSGFLVDRAAHFEAPRWQLYLSSDTVAGTRIKNGSSLTKPILMDLLKSE